MDPIQFTKMHGAGNDYIYVDCFQRQAPAKLADLARQMSDRHRGIGADGLILIEPSEIADARMRMFNADGSQAEMCGNGIRCVAKYVYDHQLVAAEQLKIETGAGILELRLSVNNGRVDSVRVDMGKPTLGADQIPTTLPTDAAGRVVEVDLSVRNSTFAVTAVSMGNPHCVIFVPELTDDLVLGIGPAIESCKQFPNRVNVEFVKVLGRDRVQQRTWERGSGETQACGTGASAVCVAGVLSGRLENQVTIELLGGDLELEWERESSHVYMTGPAVEVFQGTWPILNQA